MSPITAENQFPGSRLYLADQSVDRLTRNQFSVVAVGPVPLRDDPDPRDAEVQALRPGDWVLVRPRSWIEGPTPDTYLVDESVILGVFR